MQRRASTPAAAPRSRLPQATKGGPAPPRRPHDRRYEAPLTSMMVPVVNSAPSDARKHTA